MATCSRYANNPASDVTNHVFQNPRDVKTKFRKTIDTFYYPVGDDVVASYGHVSIERQAEIIRGLRHQQPAATPDDVMAEKIAEKVAAKTRGQS